MLRKLAVALVAASLIAGPALAQSNAPVAANGMTMTQPAKAHVKKHVAKKHIAKKHFTKKHVAKHHVKKTQVSKHVKQVKPIKHAKRVKHPAKKAG